MLKYAQDSSSVLAASAHSRQTSLMARRAVMSVIEEAMLSITSRGSRAMIDDEGGGKEAEEDRGRRWRKTTELLHLLITPSTTPPSSPHYSTTLIIEKDV